MTCYKLVVLERRADKFGKKSRRVEPMETIERLENEFETADLSEVRHCPYCGSPLIASPVLKCAHCNGEIVLRCFVRSPLKGRYIAECVDLDILSQGSTPEQAIASLQEAMVGYLEAAFDGGSTKGLVLRRSPLTHRLRYRLHSLSSRLREFVGRRHSRHVLPNTKDIRNVHLSHC
jgi:hypothetical protein